MDNLIILNLIFLICYIYIWYKKITYLQNPNYKYEMNYEFYKPLVEEEIV